MNTPKERRISNETKLKISNFFRCGSGSFTKIYSPRPASLWFDFLGAKMKIRSLSWWAWVRDWACILIEEIGTGMECCARCSHRHYHNEKRRRREERAIQENRCVITRPGNAVSKLVFYCPNDDSRILINIHIVSDVSVLILRMRFNRKKSIVKKKTRRKTKKNFSCFLSLL